MIKRILILTVLTCGGCWAQTDASRPASTNVRGAQYPRVYSDRRATFCLKAPDAKSVQLQPGGNDNGLGQGPIAMSRGRYLDRYAPARRPRLRHASGRNAGVSRSGRLAHSALATNSKSAPARRRGWRGPAAQPLPAGRDRRPDPHD